MDWIGAGGSVQLSERLIAGVSMFVTVKSLEYTNSLAIEAYSLNDPFVIDNEIVPFYIADYERSEYLKFNDYRLTWKAGLLYHAERFSVGLSLATPSLGGIYSDGKRVMRKETQHNITIPESGEPIPDYVIVDYKEKKEVRVSYRTPFSIAAGLTYFVPDKKRIFYASVEFYSKTNPYRMVTTDESADIGSNFAAPLEWLTYVSGARPVFNSAFGYSWTLKKGLLLMGGFRTDFSALKNLDFQQYAEYNRLETIDLNLYHVSCGLSWNILGQDIITGLQYTIGDGNNQKQIANLSDPVEYNTVENLPLQGVRKNDMHSLQNSLSLYFGASFNFGEKESK